MMRCLGAILVWAFLAVAGWGQESGPALINPGVPWPATDALGRELPLTAEVGPPKKDRFVGEPFGLHS